MHRLYGSLVLGAVAGALDVAPMVFLGSSVFAMASAFSHWVLLGYLICHLPMRLPAWLKGAVLGAASAIPVLLMVYPVDPSGLGPITLMSLLLGTGTGFASEKLGLGPR